MLSRIASIELEGTIERSSFQSMNCLELRAKYTLCLRMCPLKLGKQAFPTVLHPVKANENIPSFNRPVI